MDSRLCLGLYVSLLTENPHPTPANKVQKPPISYSDCIYHTSAERVCGQLEPDTPAEPRTKDTGSAKSTCQVYNVLRDVALFAQCAIVQKVH